MRNAAAVSPIPLLGSTSTCSVSGVLWDGSSQDGLKTVGETGTPGVALTLRRFDESTPRTTTPAADGTYVFGGRARSSHDVEFALPAAHSGTEALAHTGTAAENTDRTGAALLAAGVTVVVGTTRRPRRARVTAGRGRVPRTSGPSPRTSWKDRPPWPPARPT
jgi:hypothetical protein